MPARALSFREITHFGPSHYTKLIFHSRYPLRILFIPSLKNKFVRRTSEKSIMTTNFFIAVEHRKARIDDKSSLAANVTRIQNNCDIDECSTKPASLEDILSNCGVRSYFYLFLDIRHPFIYSKLSPTYV